MPEKRNLNSDEPADFVVLDPNGTAAYGCGGIDSMMDGLGVDRMMMDMGAVGRIQVWFTHAHMETNNAENLVGQDVLTRLGYRRPTDWQGPIGLTTRTEPFDTVEPLAADVRESVDKVVTEAGGVIVRASTSARELIEAALAPGSDVPAIEPDMAAVQPDPPAAPAPEQGLGL